MQIIKLQFQTLKLTFQNIKNGQKHLNGPNGTVIDSSYQARIHILFFTFPLFEKHNIIKVCIKINGYYGDHAMPSHTMNVHKK